MLKLQVEVKEPSHADIVHVYSHMRKIDRDELKAMSGKSPKQAVLDGVEKSERLLAGYVDGVPCALFGYGNYSIWMLCTPDIKKCPYTLMRKSRQLIQEGLERYTHLENRVIADNLITIKWLEALGAVFLKPAIMGVERKLFRIFFITKGTFKHV